MPVLSVRPICPGLSCLSRLDESDCSSPAHGWGDSACLSRIPVPYPGSISLSTRDGGSGSRIACGRDVACLSSCRCPWIAVLVSLSPCRFAMPVPTCRPAMPCLSRKATTIAWWLPRVGAEEALGRAVALLVVTCPCALGLATPLAVVAGIGKGARRGVLVKGGDVLERAARVGTLVLDKTGTLTKGQTEAIAWLGSREALALGAALESRSAHPVARAIVERFGEDGSACVPTDVREIPGLGIEGRIGARLVRVGSARFMESVAAAIPDELREEAREQSGRGFASVFVAVQGKVEAVVAVGDAIRCDARETVARLRRAGWRVMIASGDDPVVVSGVARVLGIEARDALGALSPEEKLELVRSSDLARPVVMVGDGVNDLAALAAADVGVAVRNGAQASHHVADVCLAARGIRPLEHFLVGARSTMRTIEVNLLISIAYNVVGGAMAFAGLVNPLVAAIIMPLSGLTVLVVALRMPKFEIPDAGEPSSQTGRMVPAGTGVS